MALLSTLTELEDMYEKLEEGFYESGDFPMPPDKYLSSDPHISPDLFDEFSVLIEGLDELLKGSRLLEEILNLIEEDSPIYQLVYFDEEDYAMDLINEHPDAHDEENMSDIQMETSQKAFEEASNLFEAAREDIKLLMEDLLPLLID